MYVYMSIHTYTHTCPLGECRKESKITNTKEVQKKNFVKLYKRI